MKNVEFLHCDQCGFLTNEALLKRCSDGKHRCARCTESFEEWEDDDDLGDEDLGDGDDSDDQPVVAGVPIATTKDKMEARLARVQNGEKRCERCGVLFIGKKRHCDDCAAPLNAIIVGDFPGSIIG